MKFKNSSHLLVKLPFDMELPLFLIKEALKSRKLFGILQEAGMTDCDFEPNLDSLILHSIGLDVEDDHVARSYFDIMEKRSRKIKADNKIIMKQAIKAYHEIIALKRAGS